MIYANMRFLKTVCLLIVVLLQLACSKDPMTAPVGDLRAYEKNQEALLSTLTESDQNLFKQFVLHYRHNIQNAQHNIPGSDRTWGNISKLGLDEILDLADEYFNALESARLEMEAAERKKFPRRSVEWPATATWYCLDKGASDQGDKGLRKRWPLNAHYKVHIFPGNVNFTPSAGRMNLDAKLEAIVNRSENNKFRYAVFDPRAIYARTSIRSNGEGERLLMPLRRIIVNEWSGLKDEFSTHWEKVFLPEILTSTLTHVSSDPIVGQPEFVKNIYEFRISTQEDTDGMDLICTANELSEEAGRLRAEAATKMEAAERARPKSREELIIQKVASRGGRCSVVADHLETHMQRAQRSGDWSGFQETLGRAMDGGCF